VTRRRARPERTAIRAPTYIADRIASPMAQPIIQRECHPCRRARASTVIAVSSRWLRVRRWLNPDLPLSIGGVERASVSMNAQRGRFSVVSHWYFPHQFCDGSRDTLRVLTTVRVPASDRLPRPRWHGATRTSAHPCGAHPVLRVVIPCSTRCATGRRDSPNMRAFGLTLNQLPEAHGLRSSDSV